MSLELVDHLKNNWLSSLFMCCNTNVEYKCIQNKSINAYKTRTDGQVAETKVAPTIQTCQLA